MDMVFHARGWCATNTLLLVLSIETFINWLPLQSPLKDELRVPETCALFCRTVVLTDRPRSLIIGVSIAREVARVSANRETVTISSGITDPTTIHCICVVCWSNSVDGTLPRANHIISLYWLVAF